MTEVVEKPAFVKLELRTAYGPVYRDVSTRPPRECQADEIPVIDISAIYGDFEARKKLAQEIKGAAENTGFFYIKNHGIPESAIQGALNSSKNFFAQSEDKKLLVSKDKGKWYNGYSGNGTAMASPTEGCKWLTCSWLHLIEGLIVRAQWITVNPFPGGTSLNTIQIRRILITFHPKFNPSFAVRTMCGKEPRTSPTSKMAASHTGKNVSSSRGDW